ncbi:MAG: caspase domain-containing protein [Hyphomicrobiaceae bacterium]
MALLMRCVTVLIAISAAVLPATTADAKRVALVIGISEYDHSPPLTNPRNDAIGVSAALRGAGFDVITSIDDTLQDLLVTLERFYAEASGAEAAVFYFAGHGLQFKELNYLIPRDARLRSEATLKYETVALQDVIAAIEQRASITLVFLDACRDNPLAEELQRSIMGRDRSAAVPRGLAAMRIRNPNTLVVFAAEPGRTASDGVGENSPFTAAFLHNIAEPDVDVELLMKRVTRDVHDATGGAQTPERLSKLTSEFVFNVGRSVSHSVPTAVGAPEAPPSRTEARLPASACAVENPPIACIWR